MTAWCVHARDEDLARPHRVEADDPVAAALAYAERWLGEAQDAPVILLVQDEATGAEHCLTLDLGGREARTCA